MKSGNTRKSFIVLIILFLMAGTISAFTINFNNSNPLIRPYGGAQVMRITIAGTSITSYEMKIFDLNRRLVCNLPKTAALECQWNGKNTSGKDVYTGLYILHIKVVDNGKEEMNKYRIAILRK